MRYGLPYKGSKNAIAEWVLEQLPRANVLADVFGGGGAITHAALISGKYPKNIYNEVNLLISGAFMKAITGGFKNETRWIDRETFHELKDTDPYVSLCFSFGNNGIDYCYAKELEPWKRALHYARVFGDLSEMKKFGIHTDGTRKDITRHKDEYKAAYIKWYMKNVMLSDKEYNLKKSELEKNIAEESERLRSYLIVARDAAGLRSSDVDRHLGTNGMSGHYFGRSQWGFPTRESYIRMQEIMPALNKDFDEVVGLSTLWQSLERLESLQRLQSLERLESLQRLQRLQSLQRLQRLQSLERLERLLTPETFEHYNLDYADVPIPAGAVIYCDPPYAGTDCDMYSGFDSERFHRWAEKQDNIFISEYSMPENFIPIAETVKTVLSSQTTTYATERLYTNERTWARLSDDQKYLYRQNFAKQLTLEEI